MHAIVGGMQKVGCEPIDFQFKVLDILESSRITINKRKLVAIVSLVTWDMAAKTGYASIGGIE